MSKRVRLGVAGLGVGAADALPAIDVLQELELRAAASANRDMRHVFASRYPTARLHDSIEALCADREIDAILVATPNKLHAAHTVLAAKHGKHVLVYRPLAYSVPEAQSVAAAARENDVHVVVGKSLGYTAPILAARKVVDAGSLGAVRAINVRSFNDWMLGSRSAHDKDPEYGGVLWKSGPDHVDVLRVVHGGTLRSVRGALGRWMPVRPMTGYYSAYLEFEDGTPGTIVCDGYGYFVGAELAGGDATSVERQRERRVELRRGLRVGTRDEDAEERAKRIGGPEEERERRRRGEVTPSAPKDNDPGRVIVSCERGDILLSDRGLWIYDDEGRYEVIVSIEPQGPAAYLQELVDVLLHGKTHFHDASWDVSTIEVCAAIETSARERREVRLSAQSPVPSVFAERVRLSYVTPAGR